MVVCGKSDYVFFFLILLWDFQIKAKIKLKEKNKFLDKAQFKFHGLHETFP